MLNQWANAVPPRKGAIIALSVDTTGRSYGLAGLKLGGYTPNNANARSNNVYLQLTADGGDVYIQFSPDTTIVLDNTAVQAAATAALTFVNTYCAKIPSGSTVPVRIDRKIDLYMHVKTSTSTAILRMNAFSEAF